MTTVTVWNEYRHERDSDVVDEIYPDGIHAVIADALESAGFETRTATLDEPDHGLTADVLADTDVLTWWGHAAHEEVRDEIVDRVHERVLDGMGLIVLHSGHYSKIFKRLMGTSCSLKWREAAETERLWVVEPSHPIAEGVDEYIEIDNAEMYGERFDVPAPETLVFTSWFEGGEVFRSGCCYRRGNGRVFYFRPGHETYPVYHNEAVQQVLVNTVDWAGPAGGRRRRSATASRARRSISATTGRSTELLPAKWLPPLSNPMSSDDSDNGAGLTLMFALGAFALVVFLLGIGVIYYISYGA